MLCLFVVKVDDITETDKDWTIFHIFVHFSAVNMVIEKPLQLVALYLDVHMSDFFKKRSFEMSIV